MIFISNNKKRAVSPVIAVLLLVSLTVAAVAIVYFVVVPYLTKPQDVEFSVNNVSGFMDYDQDGAIDAVSVELVIATTSGTGAVNVSQFTFEIITEMSTYQWEATTAGVLMIDEGDMGTVVISSRSEDGELTENTDYDLRVSVGKKAELEAFTTTPPGLGSLITVNVIDEIGESVTGALVDIYYSSGAVVGKPTATTPSTGLVSLTMKAGSYKVRVRYAGSEYWSQIFAYPQTTSVTVQVSIAASLAQVHVETEGTGIPNIPVYVFDSLGRYVGQSAQTDDAGDAYFAVSPGDYVFKAYYLNANYSSTILHYPSEKQTTINIGGGTVYAKVIDSDNRGISNARVYLYSPSGSYRGVSIRTNTTGYAQFILSVGSYKFRVDYGGARSWSTIFGAANESVIPIYLGGKVYARVVYGPNELPLSNVRCYLYRESGSYTGRSTRTNSTGYVLFNPVQSSTFFKIRVDYAASREWSDSFNGSQSTLIFSINIGAEAYAHIVYGGDNQPLVNTRVYLYTASGSYSGLSRRTNDTGYARFNGVLKGTNYKFRIDYAASRFWSTTFNGSEPLTIIDINVGGTVYAHVIYGSENNPLDNVRVYLYTASGSYSGISRRTNATGYARFDGIFSTSSFKFRVDYAASRYWSTTFDGSQENLVLDVNIGGIVYAYVVYGPDDEPLDNVRVYLYTASGSYSGISRRTNATGYAQFNGVIATSSFKFRVDYAASRYWSTTFDGSQPELVVGINIGGIVYAHVVCGSDNEPLDNVRVYLYTASGSYSGISRRTNATGYAQFNGVIATSSFKFRVDYAAGRFWSEPFDGSQPVSILELNIGGRVYCYVHDAGTPLSNVRVYLYRATGAYSGISIRTNSTGYAEFQCVPSTSDYKFRIDYDSDRYWSETFDGSTDELVVEVDISQSTVRNASIMKEKITTLFTITRYS
ncbi:MAG: hypothetical protein GF308_07625 [Candidatus Heimdallarchaeota archaeon]|nr:hypothetical protein [Candidatus Heimdallarchaeota archaeon]